MDKTEHNNKQNRKDNVLLLSIDRLCDSNNVDMPNEGVSLNIAIDEKFGKQYDLFAHVNNIPKAVLFFVRQK